MGIILWKEGHYEYQTHAYRYFNKFNCDNNQHTTV